MRNLFIQLLVLILVLIQCQLESEEMCGGGGTMLLGTLPQHVAVIGHPIANKYKLIYYSALLSPIGNYHQIEHPFAVDREMVGIL
jgi:hypothetical protein